MTAPTRPDAGTRPGRDAPPPARGGARPLAVSGALAASVVTAIGLAILTPLVLAGWIAAPHSGLGLPGVLRTATCLWLAAHHVEITLSGAGRIGMLPLGLVLIPGALLWRAGRWMVRTAQLTRLSDLGYAALALAAPYAALCGALALASRSQLAAPSLFDAVVAGFLLALCAGALGGARAMAPWPRLFRLMPPRSRSVVLGTAGALAVLVAGGALLAAGSLAVHLGAYRATNASLAPGIVGGVLLVLIQLAYVPNAVGWAICYSLGPGFAFGTSTVVAPTGSALGPLPLFPMLAGLPSSSHGVAGGVSIVVLALPYLAGVVGGILVARAAPTPAAELAPLWGFACGVATGCVIGVLAVFSGGPLGSGRLAAVGPSGWQATVVAVLEIGVSAAVATGIANLLRVRRDPELAAARARRATAPPRSAVPPGVSPAMSPGMSPDDGPQDGGHRIYLDQWAGAEGDGPPDERPPVGPAMLP